MEAGTIVMLIVVVLLVIAMAVPLLNSLMSSVGTTGPYTEQLLLTNGTPGSAAHDITSVSSLYLLSSYSASNSTNAPGSVTFTLASTPPAASSLNVTSNATGNITVNGHYVGAVNGSGGVFSVAYGYLHAGVNTVVIG